MSRPGFVKAAPRNRDTRTLGRRLDGWIGEVFPGWGLRRQASRAATQEAEYLASYRGAKHSRLGKPKAIAGRSDYHLELTFDRRELVDRARQLERSSWLADTILSASVANVMGPGFSLQAQTDGAGATEWNDQAESLWRDWCRKRSCDVRGLSTFDELMDLEFRSVLRDGDVGTILLSDGMLQAFESDQLSSPDGAPLRRDMVDGVELDRRGRPTKYHVVTSPDPINVAVRYQQHTAIPAESVVFIARRQRLGQTRGLGAFSGSAWLFDQIDGNIEAVTVAARMAAAFGLVVKNGRGQFAWTKSSATSDGESRPELVVEPGMVWPARKDEDIIQIKPEQPHQRFSEFIADLVRFVAIPFGLPLELFYDFQHTNFSNHKAAMLASQRGWRRYQKLMIECESEIYRWKIVEWVLAGQLPIRDDALAHEFIAPGWRWLDPVKETQGAMAEVDAGLTTWSSLVKSQGGDFAALQKQRARDKELLEETGLPIARSTLTREIKEPAALETLGADPLPPDEDPK